jgi:error-prone DNA polymerase
LLRGASKPEELVVTAKFYGFASIGLADRNTVAGVVRAWQQAKVEKIAYHPGCRLVFGDGTPDILAYPRDRQGLYGSAAQAAPRWFMHGVFA